MKKVLKSIGEMFGGLTFGVIAVAVIAFAGSFMFYAGGWLIWFFLQLPQPPL